MRVKRICVAVAAMAASGVMLTAGEANASQAAAITTPASFTTVPITTTTTTRSKKPTKTAPKPKQKAKRAATGRAPCGPAARACLDLSANRAWLMANGKVTYGPVAVTHGRKGWRTPTGTFRVFLKERMHYSRLFNNAPMPYSVFFNGGIAFHQGSLRSQSHGCVRLSPSAAQMFFNTLKTGDVVQVVP